MSLLLLDDVASGPINRERLSTWPRYGMNISGLLVGTAHRIPETITRMVDAGVQLTDVNWLSALWRGVDCLPFRIPPAGQPFYLFDWNNQFFERAHEIRERFNEHGVVVQGTFWELYSWSNRKKSSGIPDGNLGPWRHNVNGILLGGLYNGDRKEDDDSLVNRMPTAFCAEFLPKILPLWDAEINPIRLGNEMPEKGLHERLRDLIRQTEPKAMVIVNRNEDTPGQYANMKIGRDYDRIEFHGLKLKSVKPVKDDDGDVIWPLGDLDRPYAISDSSVPSFRALLDNPNVDKARITFSSDGARSGPGKNGPTDPYEWDQLRDFFREVKRRGCSVLHQSRAKMTPAPNDHMIEDDFFRSVIA